MIIQNFARLNIVRISCDIIPSGMKSIKHGVAEAFNDTIGEINILIDDSPYFSSIDAFFITMVIANDYPGNSLGITDANLKTKDEDAVYNTLLGGKNPNNDSAVISTKWLAPPKIEFDNEWELYLSRIIKEVIHEAGHNYGLIDHQPNEMASDGNLCPMSRGDKFKNYDIPGYVKYVVDRRGFRFCEDCGNFIKNIYKMYLNYRRTFEQPIN